LIVNQGRQQTLSVIIMGDPILKW